MAHPKAKTEEVLSNDLGIDEFIEKFISRVGEPSSLHVPVWNLLDRGGKRFRPLLSFLCCKIVGGNPKNVIQCAAAVELLHNMTLVHDDIEDGSEQRRGKPCLHLIYGVPTAINTADAMAVKVFDMIISHDLEPNLKLLTLEKIVQRISQMVKGQAIEIENRQTSDFSQEIVLEILKNKTAALIMMASELGMIVGNANSDQLKLISRYAGYAGIAFQIIDDVLNLIADKKYGKEIGGDLREGKRTIIVSHFMSHAPANEKKKFLKYFGQKQSNITQTRTMIRLLEKNGSIKYSQDLAEYFLECGLFYLNFLPDNKARTSLIKLSKFLTKRNW